MKEEFPKCVKSNPLVSVIILNYNGRKVLKACLDSVFATSYSPVEVILVDNGSEDGSENLLEPKSNSRLLKNGRNLGYCEGNNAGIKIARGEFLALLNYDTIVTPEWLTELVKYATAFKADFCQPKILMLHPENVINSSGINIHMAGFGILRGAGELDSGQYEATEETCGVHGTCVFASRRAITEVGLLDPVFFAYGEDTDWSWRAHLKDLKLLYVPSAVILHKWGHAWGRSSIQKLYYVERNRIIMVLTNYSFRSIVLLLPVFALAEIATFSYCLLNGTLKAKILAYANLLQMRNYIIARRLQIQSGRKVPDRVIIQKFTCEFAHPIMAKAVPPVNKLFKFLFRIVARFI